MYILQGAVVVVIAL